MNRAKNGSAIGLALTVLLSCGVFVCAEELAPSSNPLIRKQEEETQAKLKKGKSDEHADALYDLAKLCFENHDYVRAEKYMKESLSFEQHLNRPEQAAKTHIALAIVLALKNRNDEALSEYKEALMLFLTIPVFYPVIVDAGIDPVWFGIFAVIVVEFGLISPYYKRYSCWLYCFIT